MDYKIIENELLPIYENEEKEKLINARELYMKLGSKQEFANWIKNRIKKYKFIENIDFVKHDNFIKVGNLSRSQIDYYCPLRIISINF